MSSTVTLHISVLLYFLHLALNLSLLSHMIFSYYCNESFATVAKKVNVKRLKSDIWTRLSVLEERTSLGSSDSRKTSLTSEQTDGEGAIENLLMITSCLYYQVLFYS